MLLRFFKSNQPITIYAIVICGMSLWFPLFKHDFTAAPFLFDTYPMPLYNLINSLATNIPKVFLIISCGLVILNGFLLVPFNNRFALVNQNTYIPALFYIIIAAGIPVNQQFNPVIFAAFFIIIAIFRLVDSYRKDFLIYNAFEASICIAIASLFYVNAIFYIIMVWIGLYLFRPLIWREWVYSLLGVILPYFIVFSIYYLLDLDRGVLVENITNGITTQSMHASGFTKKELVFLSFLLLITLLSSRRMIQVISMKKILARRGLILLFWIFVMTIGFYFLIPSAHTELLVIGAIPMSFVFSEYFLNKKRYWWKEVALILFFIVLIYIRINNAGI